MWIKHSFFWVVAAFVVFLVVPLFSSPAKQWSNAKVELGLIASVFGEREARDVAADAEKTYNMIFVETGLIATTRRAYVTEQEQRKSSMPMGGGVHSTVAITNNYLDTIAAMIYVSILRVRMMFGWLPFVFPFLLGVISEGYSRRKIKYSEFGEYGATVFTGAIHLGVILLMLPVFYTLAPFPITPLFIPVWILAAGVPIVIAISNANQVLPR